MRCHVYAIAGYSPCEIIINNMLELSVSVRVMEFSFENSGLAILESNCFRNRWQGKRYMFLPHPIHTIYSTLFGSMVHVSFNRIVKRILHLIHKMGGLLF
jgi:hypothetical protein